MAQINSLSVQIDRLREQEETFWQQRSRIKWLQAGDANMSFFHQSTLQRKRQNRIMKIKIDNGQWVDNPKLIRSTLEDHFKCFFTTQGARDCGAILECVEPSVTMKMNTCLLGQISDED